MGRLPLCGLTAFLILIGSHGSAARAEDSIPVLIRFNRRPALAEAGIVEKHRGRVRKQFSLVPAIAAEMPASAVAKLRGEAGVVTVEADEAVEAHDINTVWGVRRIGCGPVHAGTFNYTGAIPILGRSVRVAVIDTGIDYRHPQLGPRYRGGYDFVNNDSDPIDDHYHGTHVAGTVAAVRDGVGPVGVAPEVDLYALKVLGADGSGAYSKIISALQWCVQNNIQVANLSLGSASNPGTIVKQAFDNAYAAGVVIVASAGNEGPGADTVGYPARYDSVIAVGSTTTSDTRSSFSSTGSTVDLAAPGSSIFSTYPNGGYATMSGTSMASPHVAGVAALVIAAGVPDLDGDGLLHHEVRSVLQVSAHDLGTAGRDNEFGYGLVDAEAAVITAFDPDNYDPVEPTPVFNAPTSLIGSSSRTMVTLMWQDNSNQEDGFEIQYGTGNKSAIYWTTIARVGADTTAHSFRAWKAGILFRVRATHGSGASFQATPWSDMIRLQVR